jgi:hypothetical protein
MLLIATRQKAIELSKEQNLQWETLDDNARKLLLDQARGALAPVGLSCQLQSGLQKPVAEVILPLTPPNSPPPCDRDIRQGDGNLPSSSSSAGVTFPYTPQSPEMSPPPMPAASSSTLAGTFVPMSPTISPPPATTSEVSSNEWKNDHNDDIDCGGNGDGDGDGDGEAALKRRKLL